MDAPLQQNRHCEARSDEAIQAASEPALDCFAAAKRPFILSAAAGGIEGLAMTESGTFRRERRSEHAR
jgi:hypothetical protein